MRTTRRFLLGSTSLAALALAGCGSGSGHLPGRDDEDLVHVLEASLYQQFTQKMVNAFTTAMEVETQPGEWNGYWDKLATVTAGGTSPDVITMDGKYSDATILSAPALSAPARAGPVQRERGRLGRDSGAVVPGTST